MNWKGRAEADQETGGGSSNRKKEGKDDFEGSFSVVSKQNRLVDKRQLWLLNSFSVSSHFVKPRSDHR